MAIKTQSKDISVHVDPLSFNAGIQILNGSPVQTYSLADKEYKADRTVVPCVLMPNFQSYDPEGIMNGVQSISAVEWYEGAPDPINKSNLIVTGDDYEISASGYPTYSLKVKKNVDASTPMSIYCIFYVTDKRTNTYITVERSVEFYTNSVYGSKTSLRLINQPQTWEIDPLKVVRDEKGRWMQEITAQLYFGDEEAEEAKSAYLWQIRGSDGYWRDFTEDELALFVSGKDDAGHWGKTLYVDARFVKEATFRCSAIYYETETYPEAFNDALLRVTTTMMVNLPENMNINIRQTAGAKVVADMSTQVTFTCYVNANNQPIAEDRYDLFQVNWYAKSGKSGVTDKLIGRSRSISFKPSILGFDKNYPISIYAVVKCYSVTAVVTDDTDGSWLTVGAGTEEDPTIIVVDNIFE